VDEHKEEGQSTVQEQPFNSVFSQSIASCSYFHLTVFQVNLVHIFIFLRQTRNKTNQVGIKTSQKKKKKKA
jgi:accessory gene regulator protein AgrB